MINYVRFLKREFHEHKTNSEDSDDWESAMHIVDLRNPKRGTFMVPQSCIWKYREPEKNRDAKTLALDEEDFKKEPGRLAEKEWRARNTLQFSINPYDLRRARNELVLIEQCRYVYPLAEEIGRRTGFLKCTAYGLMVLLCMFGVPINGDSISQALNLIQDGLDELKDRPPVEPETERVAGEVTLLEDGKKVASRDLTVKESDLTIEEGEA